MTKLPVAGLLTELASTFTPQSVYLTRPNKTAETGFSKYVNGTSLLNSDSFVSVDATEPTTVFTDEATLLKALPRLYEFKNSPIVFNIEVAEYGVIPALKDLNYTTFISSTAKETYEFGVLAYKLAINKSEPVFHFVNVSEDAYSFSVPQLTEGIEIDHEYFTYSGPQSPSSVLINFGPYNLAHEDAGVISVKVYRPWAFDKLLEVLPVSVKKIAIVIKTTQPQTAAFQPVLVDFFTNFNDLMIRGIDQVIASNVGLLDDVADASAILVKNLETSKPIQNLFIGKETSTDVTLQEAIKKVQSLEKAYIKILEQLFGSNLNILNQYNSSDVNRSTPEFGFGKFLKQDAQFQELISIISNSLDKFTPEIKELLSKWLVFASKPVDETKIAEANTVATEIVEKLQGNTDASEILALEDSLKFKSSWLIGSDAWSYDLGSSGVHHVLASKKNINMLIIDSATNDSKQRKKDVGLYALNFGDVYVASVAVYSSYTQLLTAFIEAIRYNGPSILLAYLPYNTENDTPLDVLKHTKVAVESGYWPLYRFDPSKEDDEAFSLDSSVIRKQLQDFLDCENKLTLLSKKSPELARTLTGKSPIALKQERRAKAAYEKLLEGLSGPPLSIYYASDGGNAANVAKKLGNRASARGLKATVLSMDDIDLDVLPSEQNIVFITSTAGQGEFPQDGKAFWDSIKTNGELDLAGCSVSVFGLGDSLYWPRKEDAHYYNKPANDLFKRLTVLSAKELVPLGLGDDQDADGYQTGYSVWESNIWEALGVSGIAGPEEPKPITNEDMKFASNFLRGTIVEGLADKSTGAVSATDQQMTKFHGIYMQDDRDIRDARKQQGLEPAYSFMARVRLPGGTATPEQWLVLDHLADTVGNGTVKITTRATFQLHGIVKHNLKHAIRGMNSTLMDTLAACGDVNRNVMSSALPANAKIHKAVADVNTRISEHLLPQTTAYHEIWLQGADEQDLDEKWPSIFESRKEGPKKEKTLVAGGALIDIEPMYGSLYLPRKFKVNMAIPPYNDVDVFAGDVGLIAIVENNELLGFNVYVGGGMGTTHNNKKTYPRTGSGFGFVSTEDVHIAVEKIMLVQRDNGDRTNRKHARLKYTIDDMGVEAYKAAVEELWGKKFAPEKSYEILSNIDYFGWVKDENGLNHFTCFIENGRVEDTPELPQKTGFKKISELMQKVGEGHYRLTGNQHVLICGISDEHLAEFKAIMKEYKLDNTSFSGLRLSSSACVALPTCGLAMAESERYLPVLISKLEEALEEYGLRHDSVVMRMSGCPNGCSRPWLAEIALVGKAPGTYNLMLGGGYHGQRINKLYRASIKENEILSILKPLFKRWAVERNEGEHFGDFLIRANVIKPTLEGKYFHDDIDEAAL